MKILTAMNLDSFENKEIPIGTHADIRSNVNMGQVAGGVFSSEEIAQKFIAMGLSDIVQKLYKDTQYIDLGGGQGFLTSNVDTYLKKVGITPDTTVVDANAVYLDYANKNFGLKTLEVDLKNFSGKNIDLITMRSVNHYNRIDEQEIIMRNIYDALKKDGYLISQILSAQPQDCSVVSQILNLSSLGRTMTKQFHITATDEFINLSEAVGFSNIQCLGNIVDYIWTPEYSWSRFNQYFEEQFQTNREKKELFDLYERKELFLNEAKEIIQIHLEKEPHSSFNENFEIRLFFPLIRCVKK